MMGMLRPPLRVRHQRLLDTRITSEPENPWVNDAEIVCDRFAEFLPVSRHFARKNSSMCLGELPICSVAFVVSEMFVHDAPQPFDWVQMRAIGGNEVQLDPAARLCQPFLHEYSMVIARVVEKDMDVRHRRILRFDRLQQPDCSCGIDGFHVDHGGFASLQINRAMNI